jgi:hypothetical protein
MPFLRGHHLICLNFFKGEGYSKEFVEALFSVLSSEKFTISEGFDDVCKACPGWQGLQKGCSTYGEDYIRRIDSLALSLLKFKPGDKVSWNEVRERLKSTIGNWKKEVCSDCEWVRVCSESQEWREWK